ncbi:beta-L-arabinofuranosidase domain-containing protein [Nonomuraea sp. NPDC046802]|uniref:glycoside hydrolase family 127 protein n=1 Tax=Nonomuraea sp. NPDC046802 TaxID=3154919 RepID=UPI0033CEEDA0
MNGRTDHTPRTDQPEELSQMTPAGHRTIPVDPATAVRLTPLPIHDVTLRGFWGERQRLNREKVIPHCDEWLERAGWVGNLRAAVNGTLATDRVGRLFTDSEIYKIMEAMAWEVAREPSPRFEARLAELSRLLTEAQAADGYLNSFYDYPGGPERYSDLEWGHELYCAGHLIQAVVSRLRAGHDDALVAVGRAAADHICREFRADGRDGICGHPEIETALVELYRATGERRYLDQASRFVERRGNRTLGDTMYGGRDYYQDDVPIRDAPVLVGHAVRALYLTAGAIDVAVETGDQALLEHLAAQFDRTLERRTYLTGGMGSHHHGESYGEDFELPADRAYAETCAGVASVMVAWRLLLATGEPRYADIIERTLYNIVATAPSDNGDAFHYVNTLHRRSMSVLPDPNHPSLRRTDGMRAAWFTTSCCPTNIARTLASLGGYIATVDGRGLQVHQYVDGEIQATLPDGRAVGISLETAYPLDGTVRLRVTQSDGVPWALSLRVPGWTEKATVRYGATTHQLAPGTATVTEAWQVGDELTLDLGMMPRWVRPDPRIDAVRGCAALERGPLVYCLESADQHEVDLNLVEVDTSAPFAVREPDDLPGSLAITVSGTVRDEAAGDWPYLPDQTGRPARQVELTYVPYHRWGNRGPSAMRVWTPAVGGA